MYSKICGGLSQPYPVQCTVHIIGGGGGGYPSTIRYSAMYNRRGYPSTILYSVQNNIGGRLSQSYPVQCTLYRIIGGRVSRSYPVQCTV